MLQLSACHDDFNGGERIAKLYICSCVITCIVVQSLPPVKMSSFRLRQNRFQYGGDCRVELDCSANFGVIIFHVKLYHTLENLGSDQ